MERWPGRRGLLPHRGAGQGGVVGRGGAVCVHDGGYGTLVRGGLARGGCHGGGQLGQGGELSGVDGCGEVGGHGAELH